MILCVTFCTTHPGSSYKYRSREASRWLLKVERASILTKWGRKVKAADEDGPAVCLVPGRSATKQGPTKIVPQHAGDPREAPGIRSAVTEVSG